MLYKVFYTNYFILPNMKALTFGPIVFIRPSVKDDPGVLAHELVHVKQFWANPFFGIAYLLSKKARFKYEVEAYREQLKHHPERAANFAWSLAHKYRLDVTEEEALAALLA